MARTWPASVEISAPRITSGSPGLRDRWSKRSGSTRLWSVTTMKVGAGAACRLHDVGGSSPPVREIRVDVDHSREPETVGPEPRATPPSQEPLGPAKSARIHTNAPTRTTARSSRPRAAAEAAARNTAPVMQPWSRPWGRATGACALRTDLKGYLRRLFSSSALSVFSQVNSGSLRPK
jgi:hypothetical protein